MIVVTIDLLFDMYCIDIMIEIILDIKNRSIWRNISTIQISNCSTRSNWYQFKFSILFPCVRNLIFEQNRVESCGRFFQWHITKYCCKGIHTSLPFPKMFRIGPRRPVVTRIIDMHNLGINTIQEYYPLCIILNTKIMKKLTSHQLVVFPCIAYVV